MSVMVPARMRFMCVMMCSLSLTTSLVAEDTWLQAPIHYQTADPSDAVAELRDQLDAESLAARWDQRHGWLPWLLEELQIPESSQTLVFSKTSQQIRRISPSRPRAIYFNDDVYVGWVQGGDRIEVAATDPELGSVFYNVIQQSDSTPQIRRDRGECLACHAGGRTRGVPGLLVRSVSTMADGQPDFQQGTLTTDHTTPFERRFGGWYVTGEHGQMRHCGNCLVVPGEEPDLDTGANLKRLPDRVNVEQYLSSGSDIVALMLLEHQTQVHNHLTRAAFTARTVLHQQKTMNRAIGRSESYVNTGTHRRIRAAAEQLLRLLFFCDEAPLTDHVSGSAEFVSDFSTGIPRDEQGRSLKDLDLQSRLLRYPCSYLVYTDAFQQMPVTVLRHVKHRMKQILSERDQSEEWKHLSSADRRNIREILSATHPLFTATNWK